MTFKVMPEVQLRVDSAYPGDQGGGKARLDPETMLLLKISPGDLVAIEGKRRTVAKVWRALVEDWNQRKIRIDNFTRLNAGVSIGDTVRVVKIAEEVEAKRVVLAPPEGLTTKLPVSNNPQVMNGLIDFPIAKHDSVPIILGHPFIQPQIVPFKVMEIEPEEAVIITKNTSIEFSDKPAEGLEGIRKLHYEDIGGLKDEMQRLRETIELPLRHPELFQTLGIEPPKGVLLYGPPGTGKTLIAKAVANESGAHFISIAGPEVISKYYGESEQRLREVFEEARENAPSIIFIDELDSIAPRREDVTGEVERRVVAQLLTMMDGLEERGQVVVIGATNRVDAIDAALRRPGRFDREIEIGVPAEPDRVEILKIHTRGMPLADDVSLDALAEQTHGFVGADLAALAREAAIRALRRYLPELDLEEKEIPAEILGIMKVLKSDFRSAQRDVGPSAMREVMLEVSHVKWENVGGLESAKTEIREAVEYPLTMRQKFEDLGIEPPRGVLLYGPPGTGKTLIAKAVASESGANFIPVRGPQLLSKWVGESERAVREVFKKARQVSPSIIFFDEIDALAPARGTNSDSHVSDNVLNQILTEMDGLEELKDVVVMGATNRPDIVDSALLRAGRFDRLVYIGEPNLEDRIAILNVHSKYLPIEDTKFEKVIELTRALNNDNLDKLIESIKNERSESIEEKPVSMEEISSIFLEMRRVMIEDLILKKKIILDGIDSLTLAKLTMEVDDSNIDKVLTSVRQEQVITKKEILEKFNQIFSTKSIQPSILEKRRKKILNRIQFNKLNILGNALEYLVDITLIFSESSIDEIIDSLKKPIVIESHNVEKYLSKIDHIAKIIVTSEARRKIIEDSLRERKIDLYDLSIDEFVNKTNNLNEIDLVKMIDILWIEKVVYENRNHKIKQLYDEKRLKNQGMNISDLADISIANKISDHDLDLLLETFWKEQIIDHTKIIDFNASLKNKKWEELIVRSVRRRKILEHLTRKKLEFYDPQKKNLIKSIASKTEGYVGSDLEALCREAGMFALREGTSYIREKHFEDAIIKVHPTMNERVREYYAKIQHGFKGGLPTQMQLPEYQ
jgi:transitional endoplasmic reticulum ATPase